MKKIPSCKKIPTVTAHIVIIVRKTLIRIGITQPLAHLGVHQAPRRQLPPPLPLDHKLLLKAHISTIRSIIGSRKDMITQRELHIIGQPQAPHDPRTVVIPSIRPQQHVRHIHGVSITKLKLLRRHMTLGRIRHRAQNELHGHRMLIYDLPHIIPCLMCILIRSRHIIRKISYRTEGGEKM